MLGVEELIMCELSGVEDSKEQSGLPPGFRFHPTDEELITFYLASKVFHGSFSGVDIAELDLNRCEPWELPEVAKMGEKEWYFYSLRDRKYPTGLRTNRATGAGYWKATGKDREVYSASTAALLGMKKTLVFYKGRAPRGEKTKWVMHEYRLDGDFTCRHTCKEEWVICRIFHKNGEKKNGLPRPFQQQQQHEYHGLRHHFEASLPLPTSQNSLPPLLDAPLTDFNNQIILQNYYQSYQNFKSILTPLIDSSQLNSSPLVKSLLPHQDLYCSLKEQHTGLKKCKTESYSFQVIDNKPSMNLADQDNKIQGSGPSQDQTSLFCEIDGNVSRGRSYGTSTITATGGANNGNSVQDDMSTSIAVNRDGFHMMLDPHINIRLPGGGSWPLDPI